MNELRISRPGNRATTTIVDEITADQLMSAVRAWLDNGRVNVIYYSPILIRINGIKCYWHLVIIIDIVSVS